METVTRRNVCIIDDDLPIREALSILLKSHGFHVRAYPSAEAFLERREKNFCGCLLLDLSLPGMTGLELQQTLSEANLNLPIVFISGRSNIAAAVSAIKSGAVDFLLKPFSNEKLLHSIEEVFKRHDEIYRRELESQKNLTRFNRLTKKEKEITDLLVTGLSSKQIALQLNRSYRTIESHRSRIMKKMNASSLTDLVARILLSREAKTIVELDTNTK